MRRKALLSVFHKEGIVLFARQLIEMGWDIIASGGTAKKLSEIDIPVQDVAAIVGGDAILGHRVVTLSREIHAGLLARDNEEDNAELSRLGIQRIDLVCVDLYPLEAEIAKADSTLKSVVEMTDIGGPTMLRSAAKGRRIVVCDPNDRQKVIEWLKVGEPNREEFIGDLAAKAEFTVAKYALASARYLGGGKYDGMIGEEVLRCKYGENAWQTPASLFSAGTDDPLAIDKFQVVAGTDPSYNNVCDIDRLLQTITHIAATFYINRKWVPGIAVAVKHGNSCGAAIGLNTAEILQKMIIGDELAIFGGLIMTNFPVNERDADVLLNWKMPEGKRRIFDGVIAPLFTDAAVEMFKRKGDKCRLLVNRKLNLESWDIDRDNRFRYVRGGFLRQPNYTYILDLEHPNLKKFGFPFAEEEDTLLLVWAIGSTSNSNTITVGIDGHLIGNGVGQQSRVAGCKLAKMRISDAGHNPKGAVVYSDSFFPFLDGPQVLKEMGVRLILSSSGSVADEKVIKFCEDNGITLYLMPDSEGRGFFGH